MGGGKSGGTVSTGVDKEYNRRMAAIAEKQQTMADEVFGWYKEHGLDVDVAALEARAELIPHQAETERMQLDAMRRLIPEAAQTTGQFLQEARHFDVQGLMGRAQADVIHAHQGVRDQQRLEQRRMGLTPDSGVVAAQQATMGIQQAGDIAWARSEARQLGEQERFRRLQAAAGLGLGG